MHLEDTVQLGQTRRLFLLPGGRPLRLGRGDSGTGSAGTVNSCVGGDSAGSCGACGFSAGDGLGTEGAGADSSTATGTSSRLCSS